jgi:hypothetical protein
MGNGHPIICLAALLLCVALVKPATADVSVYAQGAYDDTNLVLYIYADIDDATPILSFGVRVEYPAGLVVESATKNESVWYFGDGTTNYPYLDPEDDGSSVVIIGGKLDTTAPTAGVFGDRVLLGTVTFTHSGMTDDSHGMTLTYGRGDGSSTYENFVATNGDELDGTVTFAFEIHTRGDANGDGDISTADYIVIRNSMGSTAPPPWVDCNGSGDISTADYICVRNIIRNADNDTPDPDPSAYTRYPNGRVHSPITQNVADTMRGIYNAGASAGRQADRFVKAGDSISTGANFLSSNADVDYEAGVTYSWEYSRNLDSHYADLSPTIEHFLAQVPGSTNMNSTEEGRKLVSHVTSWDRASQATIVSYTCPGLYDFMVDEISEVNGAYSVIMCGANDVNGLSQWQSFEETVDLFAENVTALIDLSIGNNVIPLVRSTPTQTQESDYAQERQDALDTMNHLLRAIAQSRQVPFADMYSVFEDLPEYGLSDGVHFNSGGYNLAAWYDEANLVYGTPNQNLIVTTQIDRAFEVTYQGTSFLDSEPVGYSGSGTSDDPIIIDELPFIDARTTAESVYYRLDLGGATDIRVMMAEPSDDDYQVVVDSGSPDDQMFEGNLEASSHFIEIRPVDAGEYWLVIQE